MSKTVYKKINKIHVRKDTFWKSRVRKKNAILPNEKMPGYFLIEKLKKYKMSGCLCTVFSSKKWS